MFQDKMVLCASSAYEKKFYLNENFDGLPQHLMKTAILNSIHLPMKGIFFMMRSAVC